MKFVPALFAGVVVGTNLATVTDLRAQVIGAAEAAMPLAQAAADSCLTAPRGATPAGSHWYYRIDRATKRQCWYLREESDSADDKFARTTPPASAPAPSSAAAEPPQPPAITRKSIADARAEWQPRAEPGPPARAEPRTVAAAPAPAAQNVQRAAMPNVLAPAPLSSMRWNDAPTTRSLGNPASLQVAATNNPPADPPPQVEEAQQPAADQVTPAAVELAATSKPTASLQKLLLVMAAALALAGLTVSAIVRIGRMRARHAMRRKRRAMWDSTRTKKRSSPPMFHDEDARLRRTGGVPNPRMPQERTKERTTRAPRERPRAPQERPAYAPPERPRMPQERPHAPQDRERQVTEMLSRLARSAQN